MADNRVEFFEFFYDRFKSADASVDSLYNVCGIVLAVLSGVGAALGATADPTVFRGDCEGPLVVFYGLALVLTALAWVRSAIFLYQAIIPRTKYENIKPLKVWLKVLEEERPRAAADADRVSEAKAAIMGKMADAEEVVRTQNEERRKAIQHCMKWTGETAVCLGVATVLHFFIAVNTPSTEAQSMTQSPKEETTIDISNDIETKSGETEGAVKK